MTILYSLIARKKSVLAEHTNSTGNFPTVTRVLLAKIPEHDSKMSYVYDMYVFHYIVDQGIIFLCMSDENTKRRLAFSFLDDIKGLWRERFSATEQTAIAFSMNESFSPVLKARIVYFNSNPSADTIGRVQSQIDTVKDVMIENIDRVLERGEKIELLVDKTDRLNQQAFKFEKSSRTLKHSMYYRRLRNIIVAVLLVAVIVFIITAVVCGIKFDKC
eukprot:gene26774-35095_t